MKKLLIRTVICTILCSIFLLSASAKVTANLEGDAVKSAEMLQSLDLFRGTDKGFELERAMTRAEAAAMLVRFLGAESRALNGSFSHPFTDVPEWADKYVGWLYVNGMTNGVSKTLYGASQPVTAWQYATFITRAIRDEEDIPTELISEDEINSIDAEKKFIRADAAIMSARAISCYYTKNENWRVFADVMIERGMFTLDELADAAKGVFPFTYGLTDDGYIIRRIFEMDINKTAEGEYFFFNTISDGTEYDPFVYRESNGTVTIYTMDATTLETTPVATREGITGRYNYTDIFKLSDTFYIFETLVDEDKNTLLALKDGKVSELLSFINGTEFTWYPYNNDTVFSESDSALIVTSKSLYHVTEAGYSEISRESADVLAYLNGDIVAKRTNDTSTDILLIDAATGEITVTYTIPNDTYGHRDLDKTRDNYYYGEAGLYFYNGETLIQITDRPANSFFKYDENGYVINTHKSGKRYYGMMLYGGNEIMYVTASGEEKYLSPEDMSISIDNVFLRDNKVHFTSATDVGMMHFDIYTYRIEDNGKITVTDFDAGRPEVMNGFTWDNPNGYKSEYIKAEQERIDALGY